jgi:hypothetical protein
MFKNRCESFLISFCVQGDQMTHTTWRFQGEALAMPAIKNSWERKKVNR